ncbi:class I SAM-dependent methyltransferase [uncultured Desulfosarcina sp.]|uniref:class I SAM-dependent methyltransferase n=1 Tax=uncultured Desulfosarcina sp. TaxID=218289 RepID=UPI0029C8F5F0|nr:class I SAM-dependent methyltransferase [uncultured Desulfosarcina sp.]
MSSSYQAVPAREQINCRFCGGKLDHTFVDLGMSPLCQTHISPDQLNRYEYFYPLKAFVCSHCFLVQLDEYVPPQEIFTEYAYFSSYAESWVAHARQYVEMVVERFALTGQSAVLEIASNDGYLLQHFIERGIPARGIDPAANVAKVAIEKGIPTVVDFFGEKSASDYRKTYGGVDLLLGNNVLAHVPDINDFVKGMKVVLNPKGVITMEFPHLFRLMEQNQFDTIYHEHFSYLSFHAVEKIFATHGITLFDVDELKSHGGSIRIYGRHSENAELEICENVERIKAVERSAGLLDMETYHQFNTRVVETKRKILSFLIDAKNRGKTIVGYGAPGKGNTLLNYCGIRQDFLDYTVDRSPYKQGLYTPGTRIPIFAPEKINETKPDYLFILPWNLKKEIMAQMSFIKDWGGKFVVPIPEVAVFE